jgi:hypothetical protein
MSRLFRIEYETRELLRSGGVIYVRAVDETQAEELAERVILEKGSEGLVSHVRARRDDLLDCDIELTQVEEVTPEQMEAASRVRIAGRLGASPDQPADATAPENVGKPTT